VSHAEQIAPLIDLLFYTLAFLAATPLLKLGFDVLNAARTPRAADPAPEIEAWRKEAEQVMARASIVPLRRKRRARPAEMPARKRRAEDGERREAEPEQVPSVAAAVGP